MCTTKCDKKCTIILQGTYGIKFQFTAYFIGIGWSKINAFLRKTNATSWWVCTCLTAYHEEYKLMFCVYLIFQLTNGMTYNLLPKAYLFLYLAEEHRLLHSYRPESGETHPIEKVLTRHTQWSLIEIRVLWACYYYYYITYNILFGKVFTIFKKFRYIHLPQRYQN